MTKEQLAHWRELGFEFDDFYDNVAVEPPKKSLTITYISATDDEENYYLKFVIKTQQLQKDKGDIILKEINRVFPDTPLYADARHITVTPNGTSTYEMKIAKKSIKNIGTTGEFDGFEFKAFFACDGLTAETKEFKIKNLKKKVDEKIETKTCYCDRDFTVEELKNIVIELRKNTYYNDKTIYSFHEEKLFYRNKETKKEYNTEIIPEEDRTFEKLTFVINKAFNTYEINNCIKKISFLSQMYIETAFYTSTIELTNDVKKYEPYRGRGFIQLTGLKNGKPGDEDARTKNAISYLGYKKHSKLNVVEDPSIISKSIHISADSGGWFWTEGVRKMDGSLINLNEKCGERESDFKELTKLIKGTTGEFKERYDTFKELLKIMKYEKCSNNK